MVTSAKADFLKKYANIAKDDFAKLLRARKRAVNSQGNTNLIFSKAVGKYSFLVLFINIQNFKYALNFYNNFL